MGLTYSVRTIKYSTSLSTCQIPGPHFTGPPLGLPQQRLSTSSLPFLFTFAPNISHQSEIIFTSPQSLTEHNANNINMSVHAEPPPAVVREPQGLQYVTGRQLGKGGFAICHSAEMCIDSKPTGQIVALKIVKSKMEPPKLAQKVSSTAILRA